MSLMLPALPNPADQELFYLAELVKAEVELEREDVDAVFSHVPLFILADDEPAIRTAALRIMTARRQNSNPIVKLEGDMEQCFDALPKLKAEQLPVLLCHNGNEAEAAAKILCERQIRDGILLFDHLMGGPNGLDIFKGLDGRFSPRITRALFTGTPPDDLRKCLEADILDAAIIKPPDAEDMRKTLAEAYLRRYQHTKITNYRNE